MNAHVDRGLNFLISLTLFATLVPETEDRSLELSRDRTPERERAHA
ncbi:MAG TPA: hypothetical protein VHQ89_14265 [Gaiellaceae bacterium]|jgi:hypothetical protein|nr:hypothetical protein [Gaiellaceae bacterium]